MHSACCCVAIGSFSVAAPAQTPPSPPNAPTAIRDFPKILTITVVADERPLRTFQQRVSSWFSDGTEVRVTVTSEVDEQRLLASSPTEVRAWIVPLSAERALLTFSSVIPPAAPRHLIREVRLRQGFDELGLERLASVTHSAFVALSEGIEGVAREQAQRELGEAGVAAGSLTASSESAALALTVPPLAASPPPAPLPRPDAPPQNRAQHAHAQPPTSLFISAGYGVRLRGAEGIGHGPSLALGVQLPSALTRFDLQLSGQFLFRSAFEAPPFDASVQTTALRVQGGIEPRLWSSFFGQALLGLGADLARISASSDASSATAKARTDGSQWRGAADVTLGVLRQGEMLEVGLYVQAIFAFENVRYSAATSMGEAPLVKPWPVQPALSVQGRFRSAL